MGREASCVPLIPVDCDLRLDESEGAQRFDNLPCQQHAAGHHPETETDLLLLAELFQFPRSGDNRPLVGERFTAVVADKQPFRLYLFTLCFDECEDIRPKDRPPNAPRRACPAGSSIRTLRGTAAGSSVT